MADTGGPPPGGDRHRTIEELFAAVSGGGPSALDAREALIESFLPLVTYLARRFEHRGEPLEDLFQVGTIGLIKAVDRYNPSRGDFLAYATPTIVGEIRRHLRDSGNVVRLPRRLRELQALTTGATATLSQELGRYPTVEEITEYLGIDEEDVLEAIDSAQAVTTTPLLTTLDEPAQGLPSRSRPDPALLALERRLHVDPLLSSLPPRERAIVVLRFYGNLSQAQIADQMGISQMHVSRLLARTLDRLRGMMGTEGTAL